MNDVTNYSLLSASNFRFTISDTPYLTFFVQDVILPTVSLPAAVSGTPFTEIHMGGDSLEYDPLQVTFIVDEDLNGYIEIYNWMRGLGFPSTFDEYKKLVSQEVYSSRWNVTTKDIQVITQTGQRNNNILFNFTDALPISLSSPIFTTTNEDTQFITCTANFAYTYFDVSSIKNS